MGLIDPRGMLQMARTVQSARRSLAVYLPANIFRDAAWDMVLEAFCAFHVGQKLTTKEYSCITGEPPSTTIRRIDKLVETGLLYRAEDPDDLRRTYVLITQKGDAAVQTMLNDLSAKAS